MTANGCKILIPLLMAAMLIVLMLVMSTESISYSHSVADFSPRDGVTARLEGAIQNDTFNGEAFSADFCDRGRCIPVTVPAKFRARLTPNARLILTGRWLDNRFFVSQVLSRCHHESAP